MVEEVMLSERLKERIKTALEITETQEISPERRAEVLIGFASALLQYSLNNPENIQLITDFYREIADMLPATAELQQAEIKVNIGAALLVMPEKRTEYSRRARELFEESLPVIRRLGEPLALAELEMNLGLALQRMAAFREVPFSEVIHVYQRALQTFEAEQYPEEYAMLQNNLATAFLTMKCDPKNKKVCEALAVQAFQDGLKVVTPENYPEEYAMLQNNLGNALQHVSSAHRDENRRRALQAYDEALKIRSAEPDSVIYATTLCNKAECLAALPDDKEHPEKGNAANLKEALSLYRAAQHIFQKNRDHEKVLMIGHFCEELKEMQHNSRVLGREE